MPSFAPLTWLRPSATRAAVALVGTTATLALALTGPADAASRPPAPTSLAAHGSGATHWLTWSESLAKSAYVVQQAKNHAFTSGLVSYHLRGPGMALTPYRVAKGTTYYFRVRAVANGLHSGWSRIVSFRAGGSFSTVRVLSYNTLSAKSTASSTPAVLRRRSPTAAARCSA